MSHKIKLKAILWFKKINQLNSLNVVFTGMGKADLGCNRKKKTKFTTTKKKKRVKKFKSGTRKPRIL